MANTSRFTSFTQDVLARLQSTPLEVTPLHQVLLTKPWKKDGAFLEFGVYSGSTINTIARFLPNETIYGFDSFEGLPEAWRPGFGQGKFKMNGLPQVQSNVELVKGWFNESIPEFLPKLAGKHISLLHVDCDLYSSTKTIFDELQSYIVPGTVIVFDELINYPGFEDHEIKALEEFCDEYSVEFKILGMQGDNPFQDDTDRGPANQRAAILITSIRGEILEDDISEGPIGVDGPVGIDDIKTDGPGPEGPIGLDDLGSPSQGVSDVLDVIVSRIQDHRSTPNPQIFNDLLDLLQDHISK